jgi:hypothetical protein
MTQSWIVAHVLDHFAAALYVLAQNVVGIIIDEIDLRAGLDACPGRSDDKGRLAALGNGKDHVFGRHAQVIDLFFTESGEILKAFNGLDEREIAAGHDAECAVFKILRRVLPLPKITPD